MHKKLFINVFFEKRKVLVGFIVIFTLLLLYFGIQLIFFGQQSAQVAIPDFQISGGLGDDGVYYYRMYNDMDGLSDDVKKLVGNDMRIYGVTARNLLTMEDAKTFQKIYYLVYGVEDSFFNTEFGNCLKAGSLPRPGEKEALIGSYAARHFKIDVGDRIDIPITLYKEIIENDSRQYVVSGVLNDNVEYFKGGIFISKDTFEKDNNTAVQENFLISYFKDSKSKKTYERIAGDLMNLHDQYKFGLIKVNYEEKYNAKNNLLIAIVSVLFTSLVILFLLISYLMKGITKKIGLLKALGISDRCITKTFVGGLGLSILLSTVIAVIGINIAKSLLNRIVSNFLGYQVEQFFVSPYMYLLLLALGFVLFIMVYAMIKFTSSRIAPRDAMLM